MNYEELKVKKPLRKGQELGEQDQYIVIANEKEEVYGLTPAIFYIWQMCDGNKTVEDIVEHVSKEAEIEASKLQEPIATIITQLYEAELVSLD